MRRLFAVALPLLAVGIVAFAIWQTAVSPSALPAGELPPPPLPTLSGTATARAVSTPQTPTPAPVMHVVAAGDTLLDIALRYDVELEALQAANELADPDTLDVGQELLIPGVFQPTPLPPSAIMAALGAEATLPPKPAGLAVNGLPESAIILFSGEARQQARETFARGQDLGRNPRAFTTAGDSTTEIPFFLGRFDEGPYDLGDYAYLQPVVDYFQGSFNHDSVSVRVGLHAWTLFDPLWADKTRCLAGEAPLPCEIRLHNPSILFIRLGSNDYGVPALFDENIRLAVEYALEQGVIPVIGTKADRGEGSDQNNDLLRQIAIDYDLLLWDFDRVAGTLPDRGLDVDRVHMTTFYAHDYNQPEAFLRGHSLHNLTALMVLDTLWKEVILAAN
jgi:LysM repeat protein